MSDEQPSAPRPRYGEYAPGYTPPAPSEHQQQPAPASPAPVAPPAPASPWAAPTAPAAPAPPFQPGAATGPGYAAPVRKRSTADLVVTIILLALGLLGTLFACLYAGLFADPEALREALRQQGRDFTGNAIGSAPVVLVVSHLVLYVLAAGLSIFSLIRRRLTFWIPLVIGVIAAVVFWVVVVGVFAGDATLLSGL